MGGMKYSQFQVAPKASLVCRGKKKPCVTLPSTPAMGQREGVLTSVLQADHTRLLRVVWPCLPSCGGHPAGELPTRRALAPLGTLHQSAALIRQDCSPPPPPTTPAETVKHGCRWRCRVVQPETGVLRARGHPEHVFPSSLIQCFPAHPLGWGKAAPRQQGPLSTDLQGALRPGKEASEEEAANVCPFMHGGKPSNRHFAAGIITNTLQTPSQPRYVPQSQGAEIRREL